MRKIYTLLVPTMFALLFLTPVGAQSLFDSAPANIGGSSLETIMTWRANTSAPSWFSGKIMPTRGSRVAVALMATENGSVLDLKDLLISWKVNGKGVIEEKGRVNFEYIVSDFSNGEDEVEASVYDGKTKLASDYVIVPVVKPELVIAAPYPNKILPREDAVMQVLPFFLSSADAASIFFRWTIGSVSVPIENTVGGLVNTSFSNKGENVSVIVAARKMGEETDFLVGRNYVSVK